MKSSIIVSLLGLLTTVHMAFAHGTGHRIVEHKKTVMVEFFYSDDEPMSYAEVVVFSPLDLKVQFQIGRTDKNGRFAFCPDTNGTWTIEANDGMGHKAVVKIEVHDLEQRDNLKDILRASKGQDTDAHKDKILKTIAGISIIGNLAFMLFYFKRGKGENRKY